MSSLQWRSSGMTTPPAPQLTRRNGVGVVFDGMRAGTINHRSTQKGGYDADTILVLAEGTGV